MSTRLNPPPSIAAIVDDGLVVPPTVLIVDDHEDTRILLRYVMEHKGRCVVEAVDGNEAVALASQIRPDLILMDAGLPGIDGVHATHRIRQLPLLRDVPIVFISGHAQAQVRAAALAMGGTEFLVKPISLDELELVVTRCLFTRVNRHKNRTPPGL